MCLFLSFVFLTRQTWLIFVKIQSLSKSLGCYSLCFLKDLYSLLVKEPFFSESALQHNIQHLIYYIQN